MISTNCFLVNLFSNRSRLWRRYIVFFLMKFPAAASKTLASYCLARRKIDSTFGFMRRPAASCSRM